MIKLTTEPPDPLDHASVLKTSSITTSLPLITVDLNYYFTLHTLSPKLQ